MRGTKERNREGKGRRKGEQRIRKMPYILDLRFRVSIALLDRDELEYVRTPHGSQIESQMGRLDTS